MFSPITDKKRLVRFKSPEKKRLYEKIKHLMILRVIILTTFLLGALFIIDWRVNRPAMWFLIGLVIFLYILTIIYSLLLNNTNKLHAFAYIQIIGDILFETGLIYLSGAVFSPLSFLYFISIITGSILLLQYGAYFVASFSCISYGTMAALYQNKIIPPMGMFIFNQSLFTTSEILYKFFLNFSAFFLIAYLSNYLILGLQRATEELDSKQENLDRLEKLNENILRSIDSGLMTIKLDGKIISFNLAAERITGYSKYDIQDKYAQKIFPIEDFLKIGKEGEKNDQFRRYEKQFITKDNRILFLGFSLSYLFDENGINTGYIIIFQDLTEFKKLEKAKKRSEQMAIMGELAARMAHEIRNPLTSMKGSIEIISKDLDFNSYNKKLMDIVLRESDRLNSLITEFLNYAQPRELINLRFSLTNLIQETIGLLENHPKMRHNIIIKSFYPKNEIYMKGDMFQIKQAILNLSLNGIEAMPEGGTLTFTLSDNIESGIIKQLISNRNIHIDNNDFTSLLIQDTGNGILLENQNKIFSPFFSTKENGTGLGLAIVYRIIEAHNGFIDYHTSKNEGTTFSLFLHCDAEPSQPLIKDKKYEQSLNS